MRPNVRDAFSDFNAPLEGVVEWMYLDVRGLVTVGVGNLLQPRRQRRLSRSTRTETRLRGPTTQPAGKVGGTSAAGKTSPHEATRRSGMSVGSA